MKTVLVTTDLSDESKAAFKAAAELAGLAHARLLFLAVIEDAEQAAMIYALDFPVESDKDVRQQFRRKVENELKSMAAESFTGLDYECIVLETDRAAAVEITEFAQDRRVDLIVMSSRGKSGIACLLTGSVTMKVLREASCPVLIVPS